MSPKLPRLLLHVVDRRKYVLDVYEHVLEGVNLHRLIDAIDKERRSALVVNSLPARANVDQNE